VFDPPSAAPAASEFAPPDASGAAALRSALQAANDPRTIAAQPLSKKEKVCLIFVLIGKGPQPLTTPESNDLREKPRYGAYHGKPEIENRDATPDVRSLEGPLSD
jgi:hypothetical protein